MSDIFGTVGSIYNNASSSTMKTDTSKMDYKQEFLKLLLVQLKHQDPTAPFDSKEMMAQQAEFASLEQMQNLNTNLISLMALQNVSQATSAIGKSVIAEDSTTGKVINGEISGVIFKDGTPVFKVKLSDGTFVEVNLADVKEIGA